jgi:hypothetical protein
MAPKSRAGSWSTAQSPWRRYVRSRLELVESCARGDDADSASHLVCPLWLCFMSSAALYPATCQTARLYKYIDQMAWRLNIIMTATALQGSLSQLS